MKIGNHHVRGSDRHVNITINGERYHFYPANWNVDKAKVRYTANKAKNGKVDIPEVTPVYETRILYVTEQNTLTTKEG